MFKEFKAFVFRGNIIDLAVAVVLGAALGNVVKSFITNIVGPLLALPGGKASISQYTVVVHGAVFGWGKVVDSVIAFIATAAVLFFAIVRPVNKMAARRERKAGEPALTRVCPECLSVIPAAARRCAFCTVELAAH
ncbi:MAG: large conductance mechanosensitive channel protein MscL [Armatimonadota bacterium]